MYDGIPGVYETPQGAFNPGIQSLLAPERGVVQVAGNPYNPGSVTMPAWIERIEGGFQTVGGAFESLIGAGTSEFGIGIPVAANGVDNFQAGLRELWTGQYVQTYTSQAIQWGAEEVGTSPSTAYNIGEVGNGVIGFAGTLGAELFNDASKGSWAINGLRSLFGRETAASGQSYATGSEWQQLLASRYGAENIAWWNTTEISDQIASQI